MAAGINVSHDGEVVVVTLDRPPDNAFTVEMCRTLSDLLESPPAGARLLRLRGSRGVFCRGRDQSANGAEGALATVDALAGATRGLSETSLVTVAEVEGDTAGFGVGLVAQCDVSVAASGSRFWFPEVTKGLAPALVLSWLPRVVGRRDAFWLTATGGQLTALEAKDMGLLNFVEEADGVAARVEAVMAALLRFSGEVHAEIKRDLRDFDEVGQAAAYRMARDRLLLASVTDGT